MRLSPDTIDEVRNRVDIEDVVSDYVSLKRKGKDMWGCCPFHNEKTPSFHIRPDQGFYKCFGCGKGGDGITFIMELEGLSYVDAMKHLAQRYGIDIQEDELTPEQEEAQSERESLYILLYFAKDYFRDLLWKNEEGMKFGLSYFRERGFSDDTIKNFDLGYSLDQWDAFIKEAKKKGYNTEYIEKAGLQAEKDGKVYDRFRGRVIFPIHNTMGKVIAFTARTLKTLTKAPKYVNSPETEVFHKSKVLYGLFQAKQAIRQEDNCYLVEGQTDVISMHQAGVQNVVASSGTALTEDQIKLIKRFTPNITVLFDGDEAGMKASLRGIDMILEGDMNVKVAVFPEGQDPDSYAKTVGATEFVKFIKARAQDFIQFKAELFTEEAAKDPLKKAESIKEIVASIAKIPDPVKRTVYIKECSKMMDIGESVLITELNKIILKANRQKLRKDKPAFLPEETLAETETEPVVKLNLDEVIHLQERESIRLLLNYADQMLEGTGYDVKVIEYFFREIDDINFTHPVYKLIIEEFRTAVASGATPDSKHFLHHDNEQIRELAIELMSRKYEISENWEKKYQILISEEKELLKDVSYTNILRLKFRIVQKLIKDNLSEMKSLENSDEMEKFMKKHQHFKKIEMGIAKSLGNVTV
ncbi:MAG: DNA primase [Cyclobacteriaceae bacterium]